MSNRIKYDQAFNTSKLLAQAVHKMLDARDSALEVQGILNAAQFGNPADWQSVADELGLTDKPGYTALQQAQDAATILANAVARIDHDAIRLELARLNQG